MRKFILAWSVIPLAVAGAWVAPANTPATAPAAAPAAPPPGPGLELINQRCIFCHNSAQIFTQRKAPAEWAAIVEQMAARGAEVSPEEMKTIADYLGKNYGPTAQPAPAASPHG